jgi:aldehyde:ferredoxin oxidoreductase
MHDSKHDEGFAIAYQCEPTPGRHTIASYLYSYVWKVKKIFPEAKKMVKRAKSKDEKNANLYTATTWYMQIMNGCGLCEFGPLTGPVPTVEYINAATGWNLTPDEYLRIGERILSIRKAFNVREGIMAKDQKLHFRGVGDPPMKSGPHKGHTVKIDTLEKAFFDVVGWDHTTGGPTDAKKKELGLDKLNL